MQEDFSLTCGGPLYQLYLRARLAKPPLELLWRRLLVLTALAWLPPFLLSIVHGNAFTGIQVPFLFDIATHVRFLVAMPLLLMAEGTVHELIRPTIGQTVERGIVSPEDRPRFDSLVKSVYRWRNSAIAEIALILLVIAVSRFVSIGTALKTSTWYLDFSGTQPQVTLAGKWYALISMPLFQFLLMRWYYRWALWVSFLWRMSRLPLRLIPTHPDRAAGLAYLSRSVVAFAPIVAAQSAIVAGVVAGKILYEGAALASFKFDIASTVGFLALLALGPMCLFIPCLHRAKLRGELEYGTLASHYVGKFDEKWNHPKTPTKEALIGSADIQSLADMGNSYAVLEHMRLVPFERDAIIKTAAFALFPLAPLVLFVIPLDQLIIKLFGVLF